MELVNQYISYSGVLMVRMHFFCLCKHERYVKFFIFSPVLITEKKIVPDKT